MAVGPSSAPGAPSTPSSSAPDHYSGGCLVRCRPLYGLMGPLSTPSVHPARAPPSSSSTWIQVILRTKAATRTLADSRRVLRGAWLLFARYCLLLFLVETPASPSYRQPRYVQPHDAVASTPDHLSAPLLAHHPSPTPSCLFLSTIVCASCLLLRPYTPPKPIIDHHQRPASASSPSRSVLESVLPFFSPPPAAAIRPSLSPGSSAYAPSRQPPRPPQPALDDCFSPSS